MSKMYARFLLFGVWLKLALKLIGKDIDSVGQRKDISHVIFALSA
jgi:hypothetical protein